MKGHAAATERRAARTISLLAATSLLAVSSPEIVAGPSHAASGNQGTRPAPPRCELFSCVDPLFTVQYPPRGTFVTSRGVIVDIPVHFYDANVLALVGTAKRLAVEAITRGTRFHPVGAAPGRVAAVLIVNDYLDSNLEPYREMILAFPVNRREVALSAGGPYALMGASLDPRNRLYIVKLIVSKQIPIDVGIEFFHLNKDPRRMATTARMTRENATFSAREPHGVPILSGDVRLDPSPAAVFDSFGRVARTPEGGRWVSDTLAHDGLTRLNFRYRDVKRPRRIRAAHLIGRFRDPLGVVIDTFGEDSRFTVNPRSDFGATISGVRFRPRASLAVLHGRFVLDLGYVE